jgi:inosine-uridine nucleoside N-ribohydrolase
VSDEVIIDCDPGVDDALALIHAAENFDIKAVTITAGNPR